MSMDETALVERQNKIWNRMQELMRAAADEDRDMTAEERENWDRAEADLTQVSGDIERVRKMAGLEKVDRSQHVAVTDTGGEEDRGAELSRDERYEQAFTTYLRRGAGSLTYDQRSLLEQGREEARAQGTTPDSAGGYLVPEGFRNVLTETMVAFGGLMNDVTVITTSTGNRLPWPTNDDTGNVGAILTENTQVTEQDVTFGENELNAYTYTSKMVRVALQLMQDDAFGLDTWLPRKLGERIGRAIAAHIATGTGTGQPTGIVPGGTVGVTGAVSATAAITYDNLVDLEHSVNSAYRPRARYAMSDQMLKLVRKLKDSQDRPLWVPIPAPGFPATINGFPYTIDDGIADPAPDAKSLVFGDLAAGYIGRQVLGVQLMQLRERYADFLQVGFLAFSRWDSTPDDTSAYRVFQHGSAA